MPSLWFKKAEQETFGIFVQHRRLGPVCTSLPHRQTGRVRLRLLRGKPPSLNNKIFFLLFTVAMERGLPGSGRTEPQHVDNERGISITARFWNAVSSRDGGTTQVWLRMEQAPQNVLKRSLYANKKRCLASRNSGTATALYKLAELFMPHFNKTL